VTRLGSRGLIGFEERIVREREPVREKKYYIGFFFLSLRFSNSI
jgi:hypothetical protein